MGRPSFYLIFIRSMILAALAAPGGCWRPGPALMAKRVDFVRDPNGVIETQTMWKGAKPVRVMARSGWGGSSGREVVVRAVHDGAALSLLILWADRTGRSAPSLGSGWSANTRAPSGLFEAEEARRLWIWSPGAAEYFLQERITDTLGLHYLIAGSPSAYKLGGDEGVFDVWEWKAGWTRYTEQPGYPYGLAEDRKLTVTRTQPSSENFQTFPINEAGERVYLEWTEDEGRSPYFSTPRPGSFQGTFVPGLIPRTPTRSQGDVSAVAVYQNRTWMLEIKRALITGHADDYQFRTEGPHAFAVSVVDGTLGPEPFTTDPIYLYLK